MYAVSLHPNGGIQFAGTDLNGKPFTLRLDGHQAIVAGDEFARVVYAHMRHHPVLDDRPQHDTVSEGTEKT
jgi:hypothetical protein